MTDPGSLSAMWHLADVDEQTLPNAIPSTTTVDIFSVFAPGKHGRHWQCGYQPLYSLRQAYSDEIIFH